MTGKTITARANRSFSTIQEGDIVTIDESDARLQVFLASGYFTEVTGDEAKGAKKVDTLGEQTPEVVWDGKPGNRRGARTTEPTEAAESTEPKVTAAKAAPATKSTAAKESDGTR